MSAPEAGHHGRGPAGGCDHEAARETSQGVKGGSPSWLPKAKRTHQPTRARAKERARGAASGARRRSRRRAQSKRRGKARAQPATTARSAGPRANPLPPASIRPHRRPQGATGKGGQRPRRARRGERGEPPRQQDAKACQSISRGHRCAQTRAQGEARARRMDSSQGRAPVGKSPTSAAALRAGAARGGQRRAAHGGRKGQSAPHGHRWPPRAPAADGRAARRHRARPGGRKWR